MKKYEKYVVEIKKQVRKGYEKYTVEQQDWRILDNIYIFFNML